MFRGLVTAKGRVAKDDQVFSTVGSASFTVPANVYSISAVCVGAGGGGSDNRSSGYRGGGAGGDLVYGTFPVTPGETLTIVVGEGGDGGVYSASGNPGEHGGSSGVKRGSNFILRAKGGKGGGNSSTQDTSLIDSDCTNSAQNSGGAGGGASIYGIGAGGAGGYSGAGGAGGKSVSSPATAGSGGGGGGGEYATYDRKGGYGGGVHLYGEGTSGAAGINQPTDWNGEDGSADAEGKPSSGSSARGAGGPAHYQAGGSVLGYNGASGSNGGVRLVWPGQSSFFPSTDVGEP